MQPTPYKPMWLSSCSDKLFKTRADTQAREEGAGMEQKPAIPLKNPDKADARGPGLGRQAGSRAGWQTATSETLHESLGQGGLVGRGKGLSAATQKMMLWGKTSSRLLAVSTGLSRQARQASVRTSAKWVRSMPPGAM